MRFQISLEQCGRRLSVLSVLAVATQKFREKPMRLFEPALFSHAVSLFRVTCQVVSSWKAALSLMVTVNLTKRSERGVVKT